MKYSMRSINRGGRPLFVASLILVVVAAVVSCVGAMQSTQQSAAVRRAETGGEAKSAAPGSVLTGEAALGDWTTDAPGVRRRITTAELAAPFATESARNFAKVVPRPEGAMPKVPAGFKVDMFATGLSKPRQAQTAPNGDIFVAESEANRIRVLRDADGDGKAEVSEVFAEGLRQPFGIAFYPVGNKPQYVYIANTDSVIRFPYKAGDTKASGASEVIVSNVSGGGRLAGGGHWTRDIAFSKDGKKLYLSVGSKSNVMEKPEDEAIEERRARIFEYTPDGKNERVFAHGIRNPVGIAVHPGTGDLWTSVNERDGLGDHLVPDYVTRVQSGGFYGWPWYYIGGNQDPRHKGKQPELKDKVIVPDVLLQSHSASLGMTFYTGRQFPREYQMEAFAAEHGSWNRARRTGYKVVRVPLKNGRATGEYEDFMTGFVTAEGEVWGRPVAVTVARDGALLVTDDGSNTVWRISYGGGGKGRTADE
ncbi:MAG: sorbosone dehydrogenase family protein [Acidobacteriota bacterium]|nr:sorbosone dehydrogenase family protein [Acidobacteriota bacterium]